MTDIFLGIALDSSNPELAFIHTHLPLENQTVLSNVGKSVTTLVAKLCHPSLAYVPSDK
jgi:hypothetical protein